MFIPPTIFINISSALTDIFRRFSNTATSIESLFRSKPVTFLWGVEKLLFETRAWTSTRIGLEPSIDGNTVEPGALSCLSDKKIFDVVSDGTTINKKSLEDLRKKYEKFYAVTDEKFDQKKFEKNVPEKFRLNTKGIEVGHIFYFGDKYSKPMNAAVDYQGKKEFVRMGSYGVGVSRLVGAIIEAKYDDKNEIMKWPISVAPYDCAILPLVNKNDNTNLEKAKKISDFLTKQNIDFIIDDTDENFSSKIKKFNLLGIPFHIMIGNKTVGDKFEFKELNEDSKNLTIEEIAKIIKQKKS